VSSPTLTILGDSWSVGEWRDAGHGELVSDVASLDLALEPWFRVKNFSRGGASNWQSLSTAHNCFRMRPDQDDCMIIVQTDPMRLQQSQRFDVTLSAMSDLAHDLRNLYDRMIEVFYIKLQELCEIYQRQVYLVGGVSDVDLDIVKLYPRLVPLCASWIRLMAPWHEPDVVPLLIDADALTAIRQLDRSDLLDQAMDLADQRFRLLQPVMETPWIGPAQADFHPNAQSHALLAQHIRDYFRPK